ncbi:hypothetical protein [Treponema socranskii]|jgi:hypothetical protein|uniref:hypothetical protein n=1 Tax=Treponema socranskii TaxID=53419 RepID=UPI0028E524B1|nr:hypothetical protein [Treponema socranskii]
MKESSMKQRIFTIVFTITGISINYLCSYLAGLIAFPLYLDSLLTIAVTALCGLVPGIVCAVGSNVLLCIFANTGILFTLCHISTAVVAYLVFYSEREKAASLSKTSFSYSTESFMWIGFISAVTNSVLGDTISYFFYSANTSIPQVDNAVQGIYVVTKSLKFAAYFGGTVTNLIDKVFSAAVSLFVYRFIMRHKR